LNAFIYHMKCTTGENIERKTSMKMNKTY